MGKTLAEIETQFKEPFPIECIDLLPKGSIERDGKTMCMALPYADKRVYEDRLNALVPGEWSTPSPVAIATAQKIIVYVTVIVCGIPHTDVGEANLLDGNGKPSENAGTESYAQAFKRACSQFGLGRYLYDLEKAWVPYNKQRRQIDLDSAGIARIVSGIYKKAGLYKVDQPHVQVSPNTDPAQEETVQHIPTPMKREESKKPTPTQLPQQLHRQALDSTIKAKNEGLQRAATNAKQRATQHGLDWDKLLRECKIISFEDGKDIATINRAIDALLAEDQAVS